MKKVLIFNVNWLGDTVFVTPFIKAMKQNRTASHLTIITHPRCAEMLQDNPYIDEIIVYDEEAAHRGILSKICFISRLRAGKFDTAFILRRSFTRTLLLFLAGIPERIGYDNRKSGFLLSKKLAAPLKDMHKVEYFLGLAKAMGIEPRDRAYELFITPEDRDSAKRLLKEAGLKEGEAFAAINAGGNWDMKRWPPENFAKLGEEIQARFNVKVVLTGSEKDIGLCSAISGLMRRKPILLCGKTSLKELGGVFERAKWVISNDSGPMHIASAVGANLIAIFGPTSPEITGPYGKRSRRVLRRDTGCIVPCYNFSCKDNKCMKAIRVEDVLMAVEALNHPTS